MRRKRCLFGFVSGFCVVDPRGEKEKRDEEDRRSKEKDAAPMKEEDGEEESWKRHGVSKAKGEKGT